MQTLEKIINSYLERCQAGNCAGARNGYYRFEARSLGDWRLTEGIVYIHWTIKKVFVWNSTASGKKTVRFLAAGYMGPTDEKFCHYDDYTGTWFVARRDSRGNTVKLMDCGEGRTCIGGACYTKNVQVEWNCVYRMFSGWWSYGYQYPLGLTETGGHNARLTYKKKCEHGCDKATGKCKSGPERTQSQGTGYMQRALSLAGYSPVSNSAIQSQTSAYEGRKTVQTGYANYYSRNASKVARAPVIATTYNKYYRG